LGLRDDDEAIAEIARAGDVLAEFLGDPPLFRPNAGGELGAHVFSTAAVDYLVAHGYTAVTWNSVPRDWEATNGSWTSRRFWMKRLLAESNSARNFRRTAWSSRVAAQRRRCRD
jgi:peptidoglycan/xylan/chitin deacetylase (PgdA/CDA1 family)